MTDGREEKAKKDVLGKLTREEREIIEHRRKFDSADKGTLTWDLLVELDPVGKAVQDEQIELEHTLCLIEDGYNIVKRMEVELTSGVITTEANNGKPMAKDDLEVQIKLDKNKLNKLVRSIPAGLFGLRKHVGSKDYNGKEFLTIDQFDQLVKDTEARLAKINQVLFKRRA